MLLLYIFACTKASHVYFLRLGLDTSEHLEVMLRLFCHFNLVFSCGFIYTKTLLEGYNEYL